MIRYIFFVLLFAGVGVGAIGAVNLHRYAVARDLHADERLGILMRHQDGKLDSGEAAGAQVVFVGDSSLGNALDAERFSELSGKRSVNLALTGNFHYSAPYVQLRRIASSENLIETVVLMLSVDAPAQTFSAEGYFFTSRLPFVPGLPARQNARLLSVAVERLADLRGALLYLVRLASQPELEGYDAMLRLYDYVVSPAAIALIDNGYRVPAQVGIMREGFLPVIAELCRAQNWRCVYAHGPLLDYALELGGADRSAYFAEVARSIRETGLEIATSEPVLMRSEHRGDTFFHVHPDHREEFTQRYLDILRPYLRP